MTSQADNTPIQVTVKFFGPQAQLAGVRETVIELTGDPPSVRDVRRTIAQGFPKLVDSLPASRIAINLEFAGDDDPVRPGDEVALLGMLSGG